MARDRISPKQAGQRPLRVGEELRHALAEIFSRGDVRDPDLAGVSLTVTEVRVSPDLKNATAFVLPLAGRNAPGVLAALERCTPYLRGQLARMVRLRYAPRLGFRLDDSFDRAGRIDQLLRQPRVAADLDRDDEADGGDGA
ncbi:MAG TPA: 30S ribosome-binding factor RbfA [Candidatus Sulfotelmatobacter sp.]|nr:30S ribosome-binding factor RbfA [Candidatus Sulfotelmatobacter sp.]